MRGALLQHGGILLAQSRHTPALPGVAELTGTTISAADFCRALTERIVRETGWPWQAADLTAAETRRIDEVADAKYAVAAWNDKR